MVVKAEAVALPPWSIDPADKTSPAPALGDLLVAPALNWPDRTAISDGDISYTFAQLEQGARAVAARLAGQGVGAGDRVVVLAEKRAVMPLLAIAIWKCGAVYVPLDAAEPEARLLGIPTPLEGGMVGFGHGQAGSITSSTTPGLGGHADLRARVLAVPGPCHPDLARQRTSPSRRP